MYLFETVLKKKWTGLCKQKWFECANAFEEEAFRQLSLGGYKMRSGVVLLDVRKWVCWFRHLDLGGYKKRTGFVLLDVRKWVCWFLTMLCVILLICAEFV